jgi:predicted esterase
MVALGLTAGARADLLFLKDGCVLEGQVKRDVELLVEKGVDVEIPKGPFYLEDGPRRIYFSSTQIRIVEKRDPRNEERFVNKEVLGGVPAKPVPPVLEILDAAPFDAKWKRTIRFRTPIGVASVPQRLGYISPYWARVDATRSYAWYSGYLTREFSAEDLVGILSTHPDLAETPGLTEDMIVGRRLQVFTFLAQSGHFSAAERQLNGILKDFPGQKRLVESAFENLNRLRAKERYEDLKRMHVAGQYRAARKLIDDFPKGASPTVLADVNDLKADYVAAAAKIADAKALLATLAKAVADLPVGPVMAEAADAIRVELQPDTLVRLESFVSQAKQYERQKAAGKTPDLTPPELMSLAVTGWLLGGASAEAKPDVALRLWRTRQMVRAYLKAEEVNKRTDLLSSFQRELGAQRLDEVLHILQTLPPADAEKNVDTVNPIEQQFGGAAGPTYLVQLPPEYRHGRSYPVLVALHEAGEKPLTMLRRWQEAAADHGYILVVPSWQNGLANYAFSEREHNVVLGTLRDLRRKYNVDSDRVFLFGLGQGATMAFDVGLSHPDQFAGVLPMGASPLLFAEKYFRNGQYLPFYVVSGSTDFDTSKRLKEYFNEWNTRGYPVLWIEYKGRGCEWFAGEVPNIMDWMRAKRRAFPLDKLGTDGGGSKFGNEFTSLRRTDDQFYWLSFDIMPNHVNTPTAWINRIEPATLTARIDPRGNVVTVIPRGVKRASISFARNSRGESMIDFDRPVTIRVNLNPVWANKKVEPRLETLLEDLYQRGDRQRPFVAKVDLVW